MCECIYYKLINDMMDILREEKQGLLKGEELTETKLEWEKSVAMTIAADKLQKETFNG